jgi:hypothetical protein
VNTQVRRIVTSEQFASAWETANREAHGQMVALLTGETGAAVEVSGNSVQLNLAVVIDTVKQLLIDQGFALAERIPEVSAEFVLFESADLEKAQTAFRLLDAAARALPLLALLLLGVAVFVGRSRRRTLMVGALVVAASMLLLGLLLNGFRVLYLDAIPTDRIPVDAAEAVFDQIVSFIRLNLRAVLVLFLAVAVVAWVTGPQPAPAAVRRGATTGLSAFRHRRDRAGLGTGPVGEFLYTFRTPIRVAVLGGAVLIYLMADHPTGGWTLGLILVAGVLLLLAELLAQQPAEAAEVVDDAVVTPPAT